MISRSLKIKLSHFEIMYSWKALSTLLGLIQDLTDISTSPKKKTRSHRSPFYFLSLSLSLYLFHPVSLPLYLFFIKTQEKRFAVIPVWRQWALRAVFFYDIIYDINFTPVTSAPLGVVKQVETPLPLSSCDIIVSSRQRHTPTYDNDDDGDCGGCERKGCREAAWIVALFYEIREVGHPHPVFLVKGRSPPSLRSLPQIAPVLRDGEISTTPPLHGCRLQKISWHSERIAAGSRAECWRKVFFSPIVQRNKKTLTKTYNDRPRWIVLKSSLHLLYNLLAMYSTSRKLIINIVIISKLLVY